MNDVRCSSDGWVNRSTVEKVELFRGEVLSIVGSVFCLRNQVSHLLRTAAEYVIEAVGYITVGSIVCLEVVEEGVTSCFTGAIIGRIAR
jgi:hypothetical protein